MKVHIPRVTSTTSRLLVCRLLYVMFPTHAQAALDAKVEGGKRLFEEESTSAETDVTETLLLVVQASPYQE